MLADRILFIDAEALVLDKPAGLPVTAVRDGSLSLDNHLDSLRMGFQRQPGAVHRLDRDTSGCLLLSRNPKAHKRFAAAFEAGTVRKTYLAVVSPPPQAASGVIDLPLTKVSTREEGWRIVADAKGKPSRTRWERLAVVDGRALLAFMPETGRTHQLRVHAASGLGAAIVGDPMYGPDADRSTGGKMLLHARRLMVPRADKLAIEAVAPLPASFAAAGFPEEAAAPF
ncbi:RluA family pseudouridine synthase [Sphingomonas solaris]|uniref:RNA pseudouridine synthase n=1 Tax=Alterirhizorhabdus solaris TaxID=2529389 RepID=A0A558QVF5_9SPHN|nr:RNA pseudouridine synthase [Sphingomonas solaris]TVV71114.1 RNA pseudouridine synthase [Sphingomonas solaris]